MLFLGHRYLLCEFLQAEISGGKRLSGAHTCFQNRLVHPVLATEPGTSVAKQTSLWTHFFCVNSAELKAGCWSHHSIFLSGWVGELLPGAPWWPFPCSHHVLTPLGQGESGFKRATQGVVTGILHPQGHPHIFRIKETCCVKAGTDTAPLLNVRVVHWTASSWAFTACQASYQAWKIQTGLWLSPCSQEASGPEGEVDQYLYQEGQYREKCQVLRQPRGQCQPP